MAVLQGFVSFDDSEFHDSWGWRGSIPTPDATVNFGPYRPDPTRIGPVIERMQRWAASRGHTVETQVVLEPITSTRPPEEQD